MCPFNFLPNNINQEINVGYTKYKNRHQDKTNRIPYNI